MKNHGWLFKALVSLVTALVVSLAVLGYLHFNKKSSPASSASTTQSEPFYITPTTTTPSGRIYAYNSGFNREYSELCFDNVNKPPMPCSGPSIDSDFSAFNPLMSFIILPGISPGSYDVEVCLVGDGSGDETFGCTSKAKINIISTTTSI